MSNKHNKLNTKDQQSAEALHLKIVALESNRNGEKLRVEPLDTMINNTRTLCTNKKSYKQEDGKLLLLIKTKGGNYANNIISQRT